LMKKADNARDEMLHPSTIQVNLNKWCEIILWFLLTLDPLLTEPRSLSRRAIGASRPDRTIYQKSPQYYSGMFEQVMSSLECSLTPCRHIVLVWHVAWRIYCLCPFRDC
jgi:hypothetical protein